ncbi:MAG: tetratricopeptide repeat protein [Ruminococcus sp.]|jgi:tetratricopeptide (TPR) repeat protein|nr:tetratricopeptide repeat protein [Ruminococcus sp.]
MKKLLAAISLVLLITSFTACKSAGDKIAADGAKAFGEGRYADAITLLKEADEKGLSTYKQYQLDLMLAESYYKTGQYNETITVCDKIIAENKLSGYFGAYNLTGLAQKSLGEYDKALESYRLADSYSTNNTDTAVLYNNMGNLLITMNMPLEALSYLADAMVYDPEFAELYGNTAIAYAILFDFDSAEAALSDAEAKGYDKVAEVQAIIDKYRGFEDYVATSVTTTSQ